MKKINLLLIISVIFLCSSCIKQVEKKFTGNTVVEIDPTPLNSNAVGVNYPILTRIPPEGRPVATVDSTLRRWSRSIRVRVNLVGPQTSADQTIGYKIFSTPITTVAFPATISGQTPSQSAATLTVTDAVAGTHYNITSGANKVTIPANSSFGYIDIQILNAGASAGQAKFLGIQLDSTGTLMPSVNYRSIGLVIDQR
jgi:hypothetical protein